MRIRTVTEESQFSGATLEVHLHFNSVLLFCVIQHSHGVLCSLRPGPFVDPHSDTGLQGRGAVQGGSVVLVQRAGSGGPRAGGASSNRSRRGRGAAGSEARAPEGPQDEQDSVGQPSNQSEPGNVSNYSLPQFW